MKRNLLGLIVAVAVAAPAFAAPQKGGMKIPPAPNVATPVPNIVPTTTAAAAPAAGQQTNEVRLGGGTYQIANPSQTQRFADYFDVKQPGTPLTLTMTQGIPRFNWLRISIAGRQVATEKNFAAGATQKMDVTDVVGAGTSQLQVEGAGPAGARFQWQISTVKPTITVTGINPNDEIVVGEKLQVNGTGFPANAAGVTVNFNAKQGRILAASPRALTVEVPTTADVGTNTVIVKLGTWKSDPKKITVRGIPELSGTNLQGVAPGMELIIYGKNFSEKPGENQVMFNDQVSASVTSASKTQLTVLAPNVGFIPGGSSVQASDGASISVISLKVGKVKCKNTLNVKVGPFMFKDNPFDTGPDTPKGGDPRYTQGNPLGN